MLSLHAHHFVDEDQKCRFGKSLNASGRMTGFGSDPHLKLIDWVNVRGVESGQWFLRTVYIVLFSLDCATLRNNA